MRETQPVPFAGPQGPHQHHREKHRESDSVQQADPAAPFRDHFLQAGDQPQLDVAGAVLENAHDAVGAVHLDLPEAAVYLGEVDVPLLLEARAHSLVLDGDGRPGAVNAIETSRGEPFLRQRPLPGAHDVFRVVLPGSVVHLVQHVKELARVGPVNRLRHQVLKGVLHGAGLRMPGVEEHQHEVRQVDDTVGDPQRRRPLLVCVEAGRVDEDLASKRLAGAGLELEVGVDAAALAGADLLDGAAHLVEREARVGVQRHPRQHADVLLLAEAQDAEAVVNRLVAGGLHLLAQVIVDEGGLAR